jgi:uncharacterized membrane protein YoaK (UPF0700 family)
MAPVVNDAWRVLVPPPGDKHGPLAPMLVVLTVVTGLIDAFSYLVLGHVFVANMTGNVVFLAFALAGAKGFSIAGSFAALCAFFVGAAVSGRAFAHLGPRRSWVLAVSTACEAGLVVVSLVIAWTLHDAGGGGSRYLLIGLLGLSMGLQNGTARKLAVPDLTTTVLTQTIVGAAFDGRLAGGTDSRIGRRGLSALAMFSGALIGALCVVHRVKPVDLLIAVLLLVPVALSAWLLSRSRPAWDAEG